MDIVERIERIEIGNDRVDELIVSDLVWVGKGVNAGIKFAIGRPVAYSYNYFREKAYEAAKDPEFKARKRDIDKELLVLFNREFGTKIKSFDRVYTTKLPRDEFIPKSKKDKLKKYLNKSRRGLIKVIEKMFKTVDWMIENRTIIEWIVAVSLMALLAWFMWGAVQPWIEDPSGEAGKLADKAIEYGAEVYDKGKEKTVEVVKDAVKSVWDWIPKGPNYGGSGGMDEPFPWGS